MPSQLLRTHISNDCVDRLEQRQTVQRKHLRYQQKMPLTIQQDGGFNISGETIDISTWGVRCKVPCKIPLYSQFSVTMRSSANSHQADSFTCKGVVFRTETSSRAYGFRQNIIVIYFQHSGSETFIQISNFLDRLSEHERQKKVVSQTAAAPLRFSGSAGMVTEQVHSRLRSTRKPNTRQPLPLGQSIDVLAHEIKNPLAALGGTLQVLVQDAGEDKQKKEIYRQLFSQVQKIDEVTNLMLYFSRTNEPEFRTIKINNIMTEAIDLLQRQIREKHIEMDICNCSTLRNIQGDRRLLLQALLNMILMLLDSMPEKGSLFVHTCVTEKPASCESDACVCMASPLLEDHVRIIILDQSNGFDKKNMESFFKPLNMADWKGARLGFPVLMRNIDLHHGKIYAGSHNGKEIGFMISLPVQRSQEVR